MEGQSIFWIVFAIISLMLLVAVVTVLILKIVAEKKKIKELNERAKRECDNLYKRIANINLKTGRHNKNTRKHVRQYVRQKVKKAIKKLKGGKLNQKKE